MKTLRVREVGAGSGGEGSLDWASGFATTEDGEVPVQHFSTGIQLWR